MPRPLERSEKIASPLNYSRGHVIATTGGYIGDAPSYQGHVSILDGSLEGVGVSAVKAGRAASDGRENARAACREGV